MKNIFLVIVFLLIGCTSHVKESENTSTLYDYDVEQKIADLGIKLEPPKLPPGIKIELANRTNNLIYLSGNGPINNNGNRTVGKVGVDLTKEQGYAAARLTAINHLAVLKQEIGDLNKVVKVVKVFGMVNSDASFTDHPQVINGYSDLLLEVFGERGKHARSAVGMNSLPWNLACEIEAIIEISD
jgi:enamine deaminase RidA (YjgF/YER057c/UK114 family)